MEVSMPFDNGYIKTGWLLGFIFFLLSPTKAQQADIQKKLEELSARDRAVLIKDDIWIRDPYIVLGPDHHYYLTGTTQMLDQPFDDTSKYNTGLGKESLVGWKMRVWKSEDLVNWTYLGEPFDLEKGYWAQQFPETFVGSSKEDWHLWAPEIHFVGDQRVIVHTSPAPVRGGSNVVVTGSDNLDGPFTFPLGDLSRRLHDPSLVQDSDGKVYLIYGNMRIVELKSDLSGFVGEPVTIYPSTLRKMPNGELRQGIGHEGTTIKKIGDKYVQFGTGWSTNSARKGSYNLYYAEADNIFGPYGERKFVGRFLGHGTPFQDKNNQWWCTAFYNANIPPLEREGIRTRDLSSDAHTINPQGVTLVPLNIQVKPNGEIEIKVLDKDYAQVGIDEVQKFK